MLDRDAMIPSTNDLRGPLDPDEWAALGELFDRPGGPSRDTIFGFLHAVATAPRMIPPSVWLPIALGDRDFGGEPTPFLLLRHYNTVVDRLAAGRPLVPAASEQQAIRDFCVGYMLGVELDPSWLDDGEAAAALLPIAVLAGTTSVDGPDGESAGDDLGRVLVAVYESLAPARRELARPSATQRPVRRGPKVGRNDPCPCGSGKKYKKCCLTAAS